MENLTQNKGPKKEEKSKAKKILDIVVNVIIWVFVAFSVLITIIAISANANKKSVPCVGGKCFLSVQSDSMNAKKPDWVDTSAPDGFRRGDLLIGEYIADDYKAIDELKKGDIITFEWDITGDGVISEGEYNTHRIINVVKNENGTVDHFETQGDNPEYSRGQRETVKPYAVIAKYNGSKFVGVGSILGFLQSSVGFGVCIILPLAAFFIYELVTFIMTVIRLKNEGKKVISAEDEELIKQRAVEEYLRRQAEKEDNNNTSDSDNDKKDS